MDINQLMTLAFGVVVVGLLLYVVVRKPPTTVGEAQAQLADVTEAARTYVMAAEQLWRTGKLPQEERFDYAARQLEQQFNLEPEQVKALIEAGVYWVKVVVRQQAAKTQQPTAAQGLPVQP